MILMLSLMALYIFCVFMACSVCPDLLDDEDDI